MSQKINLWSYCVPVEDSILKCNSSPASYVDLDCMWAGSRLQLSYRTGRGNSDDYSAFYPQLVQRILSGGTWRVDSDH